MTTRETGCSNCAKAAKRVWSEFTEGCPVCCARFICRLKLYRDVKRDGVQNRHYRNLLQQFGTTHEQVEAAAAVDYQSTRGQVAPDGPQPRA